MIQVKYVLLDIIQELAAANLFNTESFEENEAKSELLDFHNNINTVIIQEWK